MRVVRYPLTRAPHPNPLPKGEGADRATEPALFYSISTGRSCNRAIHSIRAPSMKCSQMCVGFMIGSIGRVRAGWLIAPSSPSYSSVQAWLPAKHVLRSLEPAERWLHRTSAAPLTYRLIGSCRAFAPFWSGSMTLKCRWGC